MKNLIIVVIGVVFTFILIFIMNNDVGWIRKSLLYSSSCMKQLNKLPAESNEMQSLWISNSKIITRENFLIYGKWKPGKRHNQTCDFIPEGRCCEIKQNLHFEFHDENLNKIDGIWELRKILKTKKMLLIGDSVMKEFFHGVAELLHLKHEEFCGRKCSIQTGNNGSLAYLRAYLIELKGQQKFKKFETWRYVSEKVVRKEIPNYDIIVFNQGLHYGERSVFSDVPVYFNSFGKILHGKGLFTPSKRECESQKD